MRRPLILIAAISLAGCVTQTRTVTLPCIAKDQVLPSEPPRIHSKLNGFADHDLPIVAGSALRLRAWGSALQGIVETCR